MRQGVLWLALALVLPACGELENGNKSGATHAGGWLGVRVALLQQSLLDVVMVRWHVSCGDGFVVSRDVALEAMGLPGSAPASLAEERFADLVVPVPPGTCTVLARPLTASGQPSSQCSSNSLTTFVDLGDFDVVELPLTCLGPSADAANLLNSLNFPPVVTLLEYGAGPALGLCQAGSAVVHALDPEGETVSVSWHVAAAPPGADYSATFDGFSIAFTAATPGTYEFVATLLDPVGAQAEFLVSFSVASQPAAPDDCSQEPGCFPGKCDDSNACTIDTCDEGVCSHESLEEVCDGADNDCDGDVDEQCICEKRGDVNASGATNVADAQCAILTVLWNLAGGTGPQPICLGGLGPWAVDVDCNGQLNVADVIVIVQFALISKPSAALDTNHNGCVDACEPDPCGNGVCEPQESCGDCEADCGACPPGP